MFSGHQLIIVSIVLTILFVAVARSSIDSGMIVIAQNKKLEMNCGAD